MPKRVVVDQDDPKTERLKRLVGRLQKIATDHRYELADALGVEADPKEPRFGTMWLQLLARVRLQSELLDKKGLVISTEEVIAAEKEQSVKESRRPDDWTHAGRRRQTS